MNIVVGYIDSPEGEAAIDQAIIEAQIRDGKVVVVHSLQGGDDGVREEMSDALAAVHDRLHTAEIDHCTHEYVRGLWRPVKDLLDAVEEHDAGLIVIGIRNRSTTGKLILGSNALEILKDSTVPVLCVKRHHPAARAST